MSLDKQSCCCHVARADDGSLRGLFPIAKQNTLSSVALCQACCAAISVFGLPMLSAPHCIMSIPYLKVKQLVCYFLASFSDVQLF